MVKNKPSLSRFFLLPSCLITLIFLFPSFSAAHQILFYFNSEDGTDGALLQCVTILQNAGHQVTTIDVNGKNRNPQNDNWGAPYDQVWDMRFVDRDSTQCGSGRPEAGDYFDEHWRSKAVSFLNHCGKLFIAGSITACPIGMKAFILSLRRSKRLKRVLITALPQPGGTAAQRARPFTPFGIG